MSVNEESQSPIPDTRGTVAASRPVHLFYIPALARLRDTGEPAIALCGFVQRKTNGEGAWTPPSSISCQTCEVELLERSLARS